MRLSYICFQVLIDSCCFGYVFRMTDGLVAMTVVVQVAINVQHGVKTTKMFQILPFRGSNISLRVYKDLEPSKC